MASDATATAGDRRIVLGGWLVAVLGGVLLAGCAHAPETVALNKAPTYAQGFADGKRVLRNELRDSDAFHVSRETLARPDGRASWLPRKGEIQPIQFWRARQRNIHTIDQCVDNADAKRAAIIRMLDTIRADD